MEAKVEVIESTISGVSPHSSPSAEEHEPYANSFPQPHTEDITLQPSLFTAVPPEETYITLCNQYHSQVDCGVILCLRSRAAIYKPSFEVTDIDLIPIVTAFANIDHLRQLNLSNCQIGCNGAYFLCALLESNVNIEILLLSNNKIADFGAEALAKALTIPNSNLRKLGLHWNKITANGARHLADGLRTNVMLEELDLSHNSLGSVGARIIRNALSERQSLLHLKRPLALAAGLDSDGDSITPKNEQLTNSESNTEESTPQRLKYRSKSYSAIPANLRRRKKKRTKTKESDDTSVPNDDNSSPKHRSTIGSPLSSHSPRKSPSASERHLHPTFEESIRLLVNFEGNFIREEVLNSVTHGLGFLLCFIGCFVINRVAYQHSIRCVIASWIYCFTLFFLYAASTLYHSFFSVPSVRYVLRVFDYSGIFLLIAGTYTPILLVGLQHSPFHSYVLFCLLWLTAFCGIGYTAVVDPSSSNWQKMTGLFLGMSYCFLIALKPFLEVMPSAAFLWLVAGGACYTGGIYFIKKEDDEPIYHAVWHLFVLGGSICHFICILFYVIPIDAVDIPFRSMTLQNVIDDIFMGLPLYSVVMDWVNWFLVALGYSPIIDRTMGMGMGMDAGMGMDTPAPSGTSFNSL